jgi:hypothetical protein
MVMSSNIFAQRYVFRSFLAALSAAAQHTMNGALNPPGRLPKSL